MNLLREQPRLSILCWDPGPRRNRPNIVESLIAGPWHVVALQEVDTYTTSALLREQFRVSDFQHCPVLWNTDTFAEDTTTDTSFVPCDRTCASWALECIVARTWFRPPPQDCQPTFCITCLMNHERQEARHRPGLDFESQGPHG